MTLNDKHITQVVETAQLAFWAKVAEAFPSITSGDFPPDASIRFDDQCRRAIELWLRLNAVHIITHDSATTRAPRDKTTAGRSIRRLSRP